LDIALIRSALWSEFWREDLLGWMITVAAVAAVIYWRCPHDRRSVGNTLGLGVLGLVGILAAAALAAYRFDAAAGVVREGSVVLAGVAILRLCGQLVFRVLLPLGGLKPPRIVEDLVVIVAYIAWGLVRLRLAGLDLTGIVATSAVITAIIAFSVQDTLGNILGGLALEFDSGFGIGDWIKVDDVVGQVVDIRWRSVSIQTRNWETVLVPNSHMVRSKVTVLGQRAGHPIQWRRGVAFSVSVAVTPARVIGAVEASLRGSRIDNVAAEPQPNCVLLDFDTGSGRYAVRYWLTDLARDDTTDSAVRERILAALQRAGMQLALPEQNVHVVAEDRAHAEESAQRDLQLRVAALRSVDLFDELNDAEVQRLAASLVPAPFANTEVITRQGAIAHWLYLLTAGTVDVVVALPGRRARTVATLHAPTLFGEMGLLTGEPRHATVMARGSVECYRLEKSAFEDVLQRRPALAERMAQILAQRQQALDRELELADAGPAAQGHRMTEEILEKIKRFFGLAAPSA